MEGLPDDVLQGFVDGLDPTSVQALALTSRRGREVARLGRGTVTVPYGGRIRDLAESPHTVRVVMLLSDIVAGYGTSWPMDEWPPSASCLEWVGHNAPHMERLVVDDARVERQEVVAHSFMLPAELPDSVRSIKACWVHDAGGEGAPELPQVTTLHAMAYRNLESLEKCLARLTGLQRVELECWSLTGRAIDMGDALWALRGLRWIRHIKLSKFASGDLRPDVREVWALAATGRFPSLESLELLPEIETNGGRGQAPIGQLGDLLRALPPLRSLAVRGPCDWKGCDSVKVEELVLDMRGMGLVVCHTAIYTDRPLESTFTMLADKISCLSVSGYRHIRLWSDDVFYLDHVVGSSFQTLTMPATEKNLAGLGRTLPPGRFMQCVEEEGRRCMRVTTDGPPWGEKKEKATTDASRKDA